MTEERGTPRGVLAALGVEGIEPAEFQALVEGVGPLLRAARALPCPPDVEPLPTFTPGREEPR